MCGPPGGDASGTYLAAGEGEGAPWEAIAAAAGRQQQLRRRRVPQQRRADERPAAHKLGMGCSGRVEGRRRQQRLPAGVEAWVRGPNPRAWQAVLACRGALRFDVDLGVRQVSTVRPSAAQRAADSAQSTRFGGDGAERGVGGGTTHTWWEAPAAAAAVADAAGASEKRRLAGGSCCSGAGRCCCGCCCWGGEAWCGCC